MILGKLNLKIATVVTGHPSARKIETKDRRGREGGTAIFSELKIADFPGLCVASLSCRSLISISHVGRNIHMDGTSNAAASGTSDRRYKRRTPLLLQTTITGERDNSYLLRESYGLRHPPWGDSPNQVRSHP